MKAFRTNAYDYISIIAAETASQARYAVYRAAKEAGYSDVKFADITVERDVEFDALAKAARAGESLGWRCYDYAFGCLETEHAELKAAAKRDGYSSIERWLADGQAARSMLYGKPAG